MYAKGSLKHNHNTTTNPTRCIPTGIPPARRYSCVEVAGRFLFSFVCSTRTRSSREGERANSRFGLAAREEPLGSGDLRNRTPQRSKRHTQKTRFCLVGERVWLWERLGWVEPVWESVVRADYIQLSSDLTLRRLRGLCVYIIEEKESVYQYAAQ